MREGGDKRELGIVGLIGVLVGGACVLMALVGVANTAFGWDLALRVSGARVDIPRTWEASGGLLVVGILIAAFSFFGSRVVSSFRDAKSNGGRKLGIVVGAVAVLGVAGYGLYMWAILGTYGSWIAYYATDGDIEDVRNEIAKGTSASELEDAVFRAVQYDNSAALELLVEAGACVSSSYGEGMREEALGRGVPACSVHEGPAI